MLFRNYEHCVFIKHKHVHSDVFFHYTRWFNVSKCNNPITAYEFTCFTLVVFKHWFLCYQFKKYNSYTFKTMFTIIQQWNWFLVQSQISRVIFHWLYFQDSTQQSNSINWFWKQPFLLLLIFYPPCSSVYTDLFHKVIHLINKGM